MKPVPFVKIFLFLVLVLSSACGSNNSPPNILQLPQELALDSTNNRLFVVDSRNNNFSLVSTIDNSIVTGAPLLNNDSALRFAEDPQDIAVQDMGSGLSRIFIIGNGASNSNQITVLDYDSSNGLRAASFSPISVGTTSTDELGGFALDSVNHRLFVSNSTQSTLHAFSTQDGNPSLSSPLTVASLPARLSFNSEISRLFVSSLGSNSVSVVNTADLSTAVESLDVGGHTSALSSFTNTSGSILAALIPGANTIRLFHLNLTTISSSSNIGDPILPNTTGVDLPPNAPLSGAAAQLKSGETSDGTIVVFITQSTGDLGTIDISSDLSSYSTGRISVPNASAASGLEILNDASGFGTRVYEAAPNGSTVSIVDIASRAFSSQVF
ncbi:MAG: hypothetical protein HQM15_05130 [Deltaproteobacteria bacterium]|nr:hypothetical protein [Deltaproteobacteria bacterium]